MHLYPVDGAVHRQNKDAAAWGYRDAAWSMVIYGVDPDFGRGAGPQAMGAGLLGWPFIRSICPEPMRTS